MRHASVELPDGSVCIAFNEDVRPPPPPPEIAMVRMRRTLGVKFNPVAKTLVYILFLTSMFKLAWFRRWLDAINLVLVSITNMALYPERQPFTIIQPVLHGSMSGLMVVPFCVLLMWGEACYQVGCCVSCVYAVVTADDIMEEFVVQHPGQIPQ